MTSPNGTQTPRSRRSPGHNSSRRQRARACVAIAQRMWPLILLLFASSTTARRFGGSHSFHIGTSHVSSFHAGSHTGSSHRGHGINHGTSHGQTHSYPTHNNGLSGHGHQSHTYPETKGYSGNNHVPKHTETQNHITVDHSKKTEIHHHYNTYYSPPQQIGYGSHHYPVYQGSPPTYIYHYRDSGSRFDNLLTGLALYNLGRMSSHHSSYSGREYHGSPGEVCKLGIKKSNGDYEEARVDCQVMSSFIWESSSQPQAAGTQTEQKTVTNTVTQTSTNNNGTTTVTVTNTTVVDAVKDKGASIKVTPGMSCYLIRVSSINSMKKTVDCDLLQTYSQRSWRNSGHSLTPIFSILMFQILLFQVM